VHVATSLRSGQLLALLLLLLGELARLVALLLLAVFVARGGC
jgi:hypothetical protein